MASRVSRAAALLLPPLLCLAAAGAAAAPGAALPGETEIREYRGVRLDPFARDYDNSIAGPQEIDPARWRLEVTGLVEKPQSLRLDEVLALPPVERVVTLHCVEGWDERLLFGGVRVADVLAAARPRPGVRTVIFRAADGYSSSLPWEFVEGRDLMLAARVNGLPLDPARGFPLQVVAESRYGYKWVRWLTGIELSAEPYRGYWESRGYDNEAVVPASRREAPSGPP